MKKSIAILLIICAFCLMFSGCNFNDYHVELESYGNQFIKESFVEENRIKGAFYKTPGLNDNDENNKNNGDGEDENTSNTEYYGDTNSPKSRTYKIESQEEYDKIFKNNEYKINFEKEVVYLYIFMDVYCRRKYFLKNVTYNNEKMTVYYKVERKKLGICDACAPYARCMLFKMDKNKFTTIIFQKK